MKTDLQKLRKKLWTTLMMGWLGKKKMSEWDWYSESYVFSQALSGVCEYSTIYRELKDVQRVDIVRSPGHGRQLKLLQYSTPKTDKIC